MRGKKILVLFLALTLAVAPVLSARAYRPDTLRAGMRGEAVSEMQTALIALGYLGGTVDGIFGINTEKAVRKFQRDNKLNADGLAGAKTLEILYQKAKTSSKASSASSASAAAPKSTAKAETSASSSGSSSLFGGNYATLRVGDSGSRVKALQSRLISLGYLAGSADGKFGQMTRKAVVSYQKSSGLTADGMAGQKTLKALEGASSPAEEKTTSSSSSSSSSSPSSSVTVAGPSGAQVKLLHWYNDVKPRLRSNQTVQIYEPKSGLGWNLKVYSRGRHLDAEPKTAEDTANMLKAFGGKNTWSQKAVYVKLPDGTWTIGATHDMPHLTGGIKDNNFDGHLCVHFLRDMSETVEKDPNYGVSNQNTIRGFWYSLTGEHIEN